MQKIDPPWRVSCSNHMLGTPALGLTLGRKVPLAGLKTRRTKRGAVRNLDSAREEHIHACFLLGTRQRKQN